MARFDVYPMPGQGRDGFVLDVQADLLARLRTRVVVPLLPQPKAPPPIRDLNPVFEIDGKPYVMVTQSLASVRTAELQGAIASLDARHDDIVRALDTLLTGF